MDGTTVGVDDDQTNAGGSAALRAARLRFRAFFAELRGRFLEREDTIEQIALAMLAKEHVLLTGPPGTAKSALARAVLQNVVDRDSGLPSLFARQFTESTVQTDLIGPVDFKTLMASGRSEHFTDEGMLGAVHAFLDEVLDGRDMLLRTTLNVLQEREFKQGTKTTPGAIESAVMTSNRYLFEVLEQSRETLLAFVDRIAFVSFVPKGFIEPQNLARVLSGQLGPKASSPMPTLTLQDVDLLQDLVNYVRVSEPMVTELVALLGRLEVELGSATRADPRFVPTRYLSTRTAVRTARILRAGVVYDWIMGPPTRSLSVRASDFARLRLTLLLSGPSAASLAVALEHEVDPRERRQLAICQTENELFQRVLSGVVDAPTAENLHSSPLPSLAEVRGMRLDVQVRACQELAQRADAGGLEALAARHRLQEVVELLTHELLSQSLGAGISEHGHTTEGLVQLADVLDATHVSTRRFAPLLRTRALELLEAQLSAVPITTVGLLRAVGGAAFDVDTAVRYSGETLNKWTSQLALRTRLLSGGATPRPASEQVWRDNVERVLGEVVRIWALACDAVLGALPAASIGIDGLLDVIRKPLAGMNTCGAAFVSLGYDRSCVASRVLSTKLIPHVAAALAAERPPTREAVAAVVETLLDRLQAADALYVVSSTALARWVAGALLDVQTSESVLGAVDVPLQLEGYRQLRLRQPSSSLCHALVAACTYIAQYAPELRAKHALSLALVQAQLSELEIETVQRIRDADARRIRDVLAFLQRWWSGLTSYTNEPREQLDRLVSSGFYELLERESVLVRFTLEAELLGILFPSCQEVSRAIVADIVAFREQVQARVHLVMDARALEQRENKAAETRSVARSN